VKSTSERKRAVLHIWSISSSKKASARQEGGKNPNSFFSFFQMKEINFFVIQLKKLGEHFVHYVHEEDCIPHYLGIAESALISNAENPSQPNLDFLAKFDFILKPSPQQVLIGKL
jgi:hypothetical protein